jgi:lysozyme family protein
MADPRTAILITCDDAHEGGFQDAHDDRANWTGGEIGVGTLVGTKYGITCLDLPGVSIKDLTLDEAVNFYCNRYWKVFYSQIIDQAVANKIFDFGVLFGIGTAVKILQEVLKIGADDTFGEETLAAVNEADSVSLLLAYRTAFVQHALKIGADRPSEREFVSGWIRRINGD